MPTDLLALLRRDHRDIVNGLSELAKPATTISQIRGTLDGVRLGMMAHAEAEDIVIAHALARLGRVDYLTQLVATGHQAHVTQESALAALVSSRPCTPLWRERASALENMVQRHAAHEEDVLLPALRAACPLDVWAPLAGEFATERLRQLGMLQPSAPVFTYAQLALL